MTASQNPDHQGLQASGVGFSATLLQLSLILHTSSDSRSPVYPLSSQGLTQTCSAETSVYQECNSQFPIKRMTITPAMRPSGLQDVSHIAWRSLCLRTQSGATRGRSMPHFLAWRFVSILFETQHSLTDFIHQHGVNGLSGPLPHRSGWKSVGMTPQRDRWNRSAATASRGICVKQVNLVKSPLAQGRAHSCVSTSSLRSQSADA